MEKVKITIPESLSELPLEKWMAIQQIPNELPEKTKRVQYLEAFFGLEPGQIERMKRKDIDRYLINIHSLLKNGELDPDKVDEPDHFIEIDGVTYGFIPNLDDITSGEFADLDMYSRKSTEAHKFMAVLYRPVIKKQMGGSYEIAPYDGTRSRSEIMKKAPSLTYIRAMVFFCLLSNDLAISTLKSLALMERRQRLINRSQGNGDSIRTLLRSQMEVSSKWIELLCRSYTPPSPSLLTRLTTKKDPGSTTNPSSHLKVEGDE